jgi:hypothetical protein
MAGYCHLCQPVWTSAIHVKIFTYISLSSDTRVPISLSPPQPPCTIPICCGTLPYRLCTMPVHHSCNTSLIKAYYTGTALQIFTFPLFSIFFYNLKGTINVNK